jgi:hypothetical protein
MPDSWLDDIIKALKGEKKSELINQILKEKALYDALKEAGLTIVAEDTHERAREMPYGILSKVQKIDELTLLKTLEVLEELTTIKTIETIVSMPDFTPKGSEGGAFKQASVAAGSWVLETGYSDPDNVWENEASIYDNNINSNAYSNVAGESWSSFLILTIASTYSNKLKFYVDWSFGRPDKVDIDVYKDGVWVHVIEGATINGWNEVSFSAGQVTEIRVRLYNDNATTSTLRIMEVQLWSLSTVGGELIVKSPTASDFKAETTETEEGTLLQFTVTATTDLVVPALGKVVKVYSAFYYCRDDIVTELRWKTSGQVVLALPTLGAVGASKLKLQVGADTEKLQIYLSGAGTVKGWLIYKTYTP